jgi:hypothetical protein
VSSVDGKNVGHASNQGENAISLLELYSSTHFFNVKKDESGCEGNLHGFCKEVFRNFVKMM